ncbi:AGL238Wp [Eremothecium gossypii ATCC 10895]|uniref:AGL238Wp n=1 Tax=Eremothecium gossypii (strain ATCC 10895 / CBS 109.51 / FGSC 9923 / NRRL Y-1056) TaxID=284811 RepID=Q751E4_EREGS|nr:AGL238Wp [Eremothecium gossypii ATCC 10895]AAS54253.2 AGL238Wp [Eremothecium gossypii ATCC 10895]AEY98579.1 FAGL238Wp [Eremothecium gossypii FDAG1]
MLYLVVSARLSDNIKAIYPKDSEESPAEYTFQVVCTNCREPHPAPIRVNRFEKHAKNVARSEASFVMSCKFCGKECSIILERTEEQLYNEADESCSEALARAAMQRKKLGLRNVNTGSAVWLKMDCRGLEVTAYETADTVFVVELSSGSTMECTFEDGEREWFDYDDNAGEEVSIEEVSFQIIKGK